ncbi:hypothetical protein HKD37_05G013254 [Glycine soja]
MDRDSENEVVNLSLMSKNYESEEEITSSNNNLSISFDELQDAFNDLHKESIKLVSFSKKIISNLKSSTSTTTVAGQRCHDTSSDSTAPPNPSISSPRSLTLFSSDDQHDEHFVKVKRSFAIGAAVVASFGYRKDMDGQWVRKQDLPSTVPDEHTPSPSPQRDSSSSLLHDVISELRDLQAFVGNRFDVMDSRITRLDDDMSFIR